MKRITVLTRALLLAAVACITQVSAHPAGREGLASADRDGRMAQRAQLAWASASDPTRAAMIDLLVLERAYRQRQDLASAIALYREAAGSTTNSTLRNFAERRLARLQWRGGQQDEAIALIRGNLERNLQAASAQSAQP